jgi:Beta-propeller repeat
MSVPRPFNQIMFGVLVLAATVAGPSARLAGETSHSQKAANLPTSHAEPTVETRAAYLQTPLRFEPLGRVADTGSAFVARGAGYAVHLTSFGAAITLRPRSTKTPDTVTLRLVGGRRTAHGIGRKQLPGLTNHVIGNDPRRWKTGVRGYGEVRYHNVYRGIDVIYYGNQRQLEYDFVVAPGAKPSDITLAIDGADRVYLDTHGNLVVTTLSGDLIHRAPILYQERDGQRDLVGGGYVIRRNGQVGFRVGAYDGRRPLIIDPILSYSSYLGGANQERGKDITVDSQGNILVVGETYSPDFPTAHALQPEASNLGDAFVAKLNPRGDALIYSTYFGGFNWDSAVTITTDSAGNAYVAGHTFSWDFPTSNAAQSAFGGNSDGFVAKLDASGGLVYSTFLGGALEDYVTGIAVDSDGRAHVGGQTISVDFPTLNPFQPSLAGDPGFRTTDGGETWTGMGASLASVSVHTFAIDRAHPSTVYAGTEDGLVFRSDDRGITWTRASEELPLLPVRALAVAEGMPATLYAATQVGLYRSRDGGATWTDAQLWGSVTALVVAPGSPSTVFAGLGQESSPTGVFKTTDGGDSWTDTGLSAGINALAMSGTTLYAATVNGVFSSAGGEGWTPANTGLPTQVLALAADPLEPAVAYAGTMEGFFKTTSSGGDWQPDPALTGVAIAAVAIAETDPLTVFVTSVFGGAAVTNDGGVNWRLTGRPDAGGFALAVDPQVATIAYMGGSRNWDAFVSTIAADGSTLEFSTYFGGTSTDIGTDLALDGNGAAYIVGWTHSTDFPVRNALQSTHRGLMEVFLAKISAEHTVQYATYLGGSGSDYFARVGVDALGQAHVAGITVSLDFPTVNASQPTAGGGFGDIFVSKLTADGSAFVYSTYLGGRALENDTTQSLGPALHVTPAGEAYVAGATTSTDFPTTPDAVQRTHSGDRNDVFVTKFDAAGAMQYSTLLGGSAEDHATGIAVDSAGAILVTGYTLSANWPTANALQPTLAGPDDAFVARIGEPLADTTAPQIQITSPESRDYLHTDTLTIAFSASDSESGINGAPTVTLDGAPVAGSQIELLTLSLGEHTVEVSAIDGAGNAAQQAVSFRVVATIDSLIATVDALSAEIEPWLRTTLRARLIAAKLALARGAEALADYELRQVINQCTRQSGRAMTTSAAALLIADTQFVLDGF